MTDIPKRMTTAQALSATYAARYRDGSGVIENLSFEEAYDLFEELKDTDNPVDVYPFPVPEYKAP